MNQFIIKKKILGSIENCKISNLNNLFKEIYKRLLIPFYIPVLTLITFILILSSKENTDYSRLKLLTFLLGLFFIIFSETTIRFISETLIKNIYIVSIPYITFFILYLILYRKFTFNNFK